MKFLATADQTVSGQLVTSSARNLLDVVLTFPYIELQSRRQKRISFYYSLIVGPTYGPSKIAKPAVFQAVLRGIGKSFQSAITAPRMNLTGYGNATAQSYLS